MVDYNFNSIWIPLVEFQIYGFNHQSLHFMIIYIELYNFIVISLLPNQLNKILYTLIDFENKKKTVFRFLPGTCRPNPAGGLPALPTATWELPKAIGFFFKLKFSQVWKKNTAAYFQFNVAPTDASDGKIDITIQLALFGIISMVWEMIYLVLDKLISERKRSNAHYKLWENLEVEWRVSQVR